MQDTKSTLDHVAAPIQDPRESPKQVELKPITRDGAMDVPRGDGQRLTQIGEIPTGYRRSLFGR